MQDILKEFGANEVDYFSRFIIDIHFKLVDEFHV